MKLVNEIQATLTNSFNVWVRNRITKRGVRGCLIEVRTKNEFGAITINRGVTDDNGFVNITVPGSLFHTYGHDVKLLSVPPEYVKVLPDIYHIPIDGWGKTVNVYFNVDSVSSGGGAGGGGAPPGESEKPVVPPGEDIFQWLKSNILWIVIAIVVIVVIIVLFRKFKR